MDPSSGALVSRLISAATTNATAVKGASGRLVGFVCGNTNAALRYLKIYDKATAPVVGTDVPKLTFIIQSMAALGTPQPTTVVFPVEGVYFENGISFAITGALADSDTTAISAGDLVLDLFYY